MRKISRRVVKKLNRISTYLAGSMPFSKHFEIRKYRLCLLLTCEIVFSFTFRLSKICYQKEATFDRKGNNAKKQRYPMQQGQKEERRFFQKVRDNDIISHTLPTFNKVYYYKLDDTIELECL